MITTFVWLKLWAYHSPHPKKDCWEKHTHRRWPSECVLCGEDAKGRSWYYPCGTPNPPEPAIMRLHEHCAAALMLSGAKWGKYDTEKGETVEQHGEPSRDDG